MAEDHELVDGNRPCCHELLEDCRERVAIRRDMKTAVVEQIERRVAEVARERRAVIVAGAGELRIRHTRAVNQEHDLGRRIRERGAQRIRCEIDGSACMSDVHLDRERIGGLVQVVAEHAVDDG
jgi:hypothetical protein